MSAEIRPLEASDRLEVHDVLVRAGNFTDDEVGVAMELVDEWLADGEDSGYITYVIADEAMPRPVRGYVCFGPAPMTEGTFDLYWIAVDPDAQGHGLGARLLAAAEEEIRSRGGRLLLIETATQDSYAPTIRFYERSGYAIISRVDDYYRPGDDKITFGKRLRT